MKCFRPVCKHKADVIYWAQDHVSRSMRSACLAHTQLARNAVKKEKPDAVIHRHKVKDGRILLPVLPPGQQTGERETDLALTITIPHFGKPEHDYETARRILRGLQVSLHSHVTAELITEEGELIPIEIGDDHGM